MNNTVTMKNTLQNLISKTNEKAFITMARKVSNVLAALFTVALVVQYVEFKGVVNLGIVQTGATLGLMYSLANKCQTYLLKLRIESLISGNEIPILESKESTEEQ